MVAATIAAAVSILIFGLGYSRKAGELDAAALTTRR
jgi:hypothetical protein